MLSGHRGLSPFTRDDDDEYRSHEDLEAENARLRQELSRTRRNHRSSSLGRDTLRPQDRRLSLNTSANGRAQEQLREVIEENDLLVERLKMKEKDLDELAQENTRLQRRLEEEQCQQLAAKEAKDSNPKDIRLFKRHAQDIMKRMQEEKEVDLAKADQARKLLKMQLDDSQARCAKAKSEIVRLERELSHAEAFNLKQEMKLQDLQQHTEELRGMLDGERNTAEQMQVKVSRLEEELENERLSKQNIGETLDMLHGGGQYRSSIDSQPDSLAGLMDDGLPDAVSRSTPEISGREEQVVELQQECEQLRAQLAIALRRTSSQGPEQRDVVERVPQSSSMEVQQECRDLRQHLAEARSELATLQGQLAESWQERAALQERLSEVSRTSQRSADVCTGSAAGATALGPKANIKSEPPNSGIHEAEELRRKLATAEAQLADALREKEVFRKALTPAEDHAKGAAPSPTTTEGAAPSHAAPNHLTCAPELEQELRERITSLEQQLVEAARKAESQQPHEQSYNLSNASPAGQPSCGISAERPSNGCTLTEEELRRECQRLRDRLVTLGDTAFEPSVRNPEAELDQAKTQLAEAKRELERARVGAAVAGGAASKVEVTLPEPESHTKTSTGESAQAGASPRPCLRPSLTSSSTVTACSTTASTNTSNLSCQSCEGWQEEVAQARDELAKAREREVRLQHEADQLRLQQEKEAAEGEKHNKMAEEVKSLQLRTEALGKREEEHQQELDTVVAEKERAAREVQELRQRLEGASQKESELVKALQERVRAAETLTSQLHDQEELTQSLHAAKTAEIEAQQTVAEMRGRLSEAQGRVNEMEKKAEENSNLANQVLGLKTKLEATEKLVSDQNKAAELGVSTQQKEVLDKSNTAPPSKPADGPARQSVAIADGIRASRLSLAVCRSCESLRQELASANERQHKLQIELREEMLQKNEELLAMNRHFQQQLDPNQEKEKESETYPARFAGEPKDLQESLQAAKAAEMEARKKAEELQAKVDDVPLLVNQIQELKVKLEQVEKQASASTTTREGQIASPPCQTCESLRQDLAAAKQDVREHLDVARRNEELVATSNLLQQQLEACREKAAGDLPCASSLAEEAGKLSQECDQLRERLHAAKLAELEAQRKADEVPALMSQILDLKLKLVIAEKRAVDCKKDLEIFRSPTGSAAARQELGGSGASDHHLAEAREQLHRLEREVSSLKRQVADSQQLEQEHKHVANVMRKQLAEACGTPVVIVPDVETNSVQLAGAAPASGGQKAPLRTCGGLDDRFLTGEREEMGRRIEELLAANQKLFQQLHEAQTMGDATCAEMVKALWQESERLRDQLHAAKMAELDAQKKADDVPGLMTQILDLKKQAAALEREVQEWKRAATETSFSGLFSSFVCAGPGSRQR